jgi:YVTN family beta-propeller protein
MTDENKKRKTLIRSISAVLIVSISLVLGLITTSTQANADSVIATITVGKNPVISAFDSSNGYVYVPNQADNTVSVTNGVTNTVVGPPIPVGSGPTALTFDPSNNSLYVSNSNVNTVSVISTIPSNLYITDSGNNRVEKFTSSGTFISAFGSTGSGNGQFNTPSGITAGA